MKFRTFRALFALAILLSCGGVCLIAWGYSEQKVSANSTKDPVTVDLAKLESGEPLPSNHITIGPHYACYYTTVYSYREKKHAKGTVGPETKLQYVIYPIVSTTHPQVKELIDIAKAKKKAKKDDEEDEPPIEHFAVVVKTDRFKKLGDIPDDTLRHEDSIHGLVINEVRPLDAEERKLLQDTFPKMDLKKVYVLDENRTPSSSTTSWLAILGGIAGVAIGVLGAVVVLILGLIGLFRR